MHESFFALKAKTKAVICLFFLLQSTQDLNCFNETTDTLQNKNAALKLFFFFFDVLSHFLIFGNLKPLKTLFPQLPLTLQSYSWNGGWSKVTEYLHGD